MKLDSIQVSQFRNIESLSISPSPDVNLVYGENGSGKSSFLEAIHFLGYGRSFRTHKPKNVIRDGSEKFTIFVECSRESEESIKVGIQRSLDDAFLCSINGQRSNKISDIVSLVPVQLFTPQSIELIIGSPSSRRKFLDWGLFHVEQSFHELSKHYQRVLRHRNALLKRFQTMQINTNTTNSSELDYWSHQLVLLGDKIDQLRRAYWEAFEAPFRRISGEFLPEFSFDLSYYRGWDKTFSLEENISKKLDVDTRYGYTTSGPHKGDFRLRVNGKPVSEVLSRGQLRMVVAALHIAQSNHLFSAVQQGGIFLLDDLGAELDEQHREKFVRELIASNAQLFLTAIEQSQFVIPSEINNKKLFHVKHGHVTEE